jgi:methyltransferase-like protein/SAM-dependent methyltransferase
MDEQAETPAAAVSAYDAVPYSVCAFAQTQPDRLATIATLFGMEPARPERCRVLELGCAQGGNLIPMALASPGSHFVGVDLSARQIADGQAVVRELGLKNVDLQAASILDIGEDFGTFDYILAHGVYSWVPPEVQEKILELCSRNLAPNGAAYISYNALPGWHARGALREMIWYHTAHLADPIERVRQARGLLAFLAKSMPQQLPGYSALIRQELGLLLRTPDSYLLHEHLEEFNEPFYFHQFVERAASKRLQYLGEAQVSSMLADRFGAEGEKTLRQISADMLHMEQYMDFLRNRMFRQTLLCHADVKLEHALRPETMMKFRIASPAKPVSNVCDIHSEHGEEFAAEGAARLNTHDPLMKAVMLHLAQQWPLSVPFEELHGAARWRLGWTAEHPQEEAVQLAIRLLNCYTSALVELSMSCPAFVVEVGERPIASPYARLRARQGTKVVNMRLESVELGEKSSEILRQLDGGHDRAALSAIVRGWLKSSDESAEVNREASAEEYVERMLKAFAQAALLVG